MKRLLFEVCANGLASALAAQKSGAGRIELCEALELGGLTPSFGSLQLVRTSVQIPVRVLIRPRPGDFHYSEAEQSVMLKDIELVRKMGFEGIVIGALNRENMPDLVVLNRIVDAAQGLRLTFHRAIDESADPLEALQIVMDSGFDCVLTSGAQATALQGVSTISRMVRLAQDHIVVMAGGGVRPDNIKLILDETGVSAIHFSAAAKRATAVGADQLSERTGLALGYSTSDEQMIAEMMQQATKK